MSHGWTCNFLVKGGGFCTKAWDHQGPHYAGPKAEQRAAAANIVPPTVDAPQVDDDGVKWVCEPYFVPQTTNDWAKVWATFDRAAATDVRRRP